MNPNLRDAVSDLLDDAAVRIYTHGHHNGPGWYVRPTQWEDGPLDVYVTTAPVSGHAAIYLAAGLDPATRAVGQTPATVFLAETRWATELIRSGEPSVFDTDGFVDFAATIAAYEKQPGRTAQQVAESLRVAASSGKSPIGARP